MKPRSGNFLHFSSMQHNSVHKYFKWFWKRKWDYKSFKQCWFVSSGCSCPIWVGHQLFLQGVWLLKEDILFYMAYISIFTLMRPFFLVFLGASRGVQQNCITKPNRSVGLVFCSLQYGIGINFFLSIFAVWYWVRHSFFKTAIYWGNWYEYKSGYDVFLFKINCHYLLGGRTYMGTIN